MPTIIINNNMVNCFCYYIPIQTISLRYKMGSLLISKLQYVQILNLKYKDPWPFGRTAKNWIWYIVGSSPYPYVIIVALTKPTYIQHRNLWWLYIHRSCCRDINNYYWFVGCIMYTCVTERAVKKSRKITIIMLKLC